MIIIKDYTGGAKTVHGPFTECTFRCLTQSFPACEAPTVTYTVVTPEGEYQPLTVSLVHSIEAVAN